MRNSIGHSVMLTIAFAGHAWAAMFTVDVVPTSGTSVSPGASVSYQITGVLSGEANLGLAGFGLDLRTDTGVIQAQASPGPSMAPFVKNAGFGNPAGFGGTVNGDDLVQIGGAQNTIGNDGPPAHPPYPAGAVAEGIAVGGAVVLATGTITAPQLPGTYTVSLANPVAAVLTQNMGTRYGVQAADAAVGTNGSFQIVVAGEPDTDGDGVPDSTDLCPDTIPDVPVDAHGCPPMIPGDFDRDGDVDLSDFDTFETCGSGPAVLYVGDCAKADFDSDTDVDQSDFSVFQRCYSGENVPADPNCGA